MDGWDGSIRGMIMGNFKRLPLNSYSLTVKHASEKLLPFVPPCFTQKLFKPNLYIEKNIDW